MPDRDAPSGLSSPPCFAHELAENAEGGFDVTDEQQRTDVARWRKSEREKLIALRLSHSADQRRQWSSAVAEEVLRLAGDFRGRIVSFYWPFRGEPDLRPLLEAVVTQGGTAALPVVVEKGRPLEFRSWRPGEPLEPGILKIPIPKRGAPVSPAVVLAPVVGFDAGCFRLGYGGGFFDRTLAAIDTKPMALGVGYASARIATIFPQPHDVPMDAVVTEEGVFRRESE